MPSDAVNKLCVPKEPKPPSPCKRGHLAGRKKNGTCKECSKAFNRRTYASNPEKSLAASKSWNARNRERGLEASRRFYQRNPERMREASRRWRQQNPGKFIEQWKSRKLLKARRTPKWLTAEHREEMRALYATARAMRDAGLDIHVDHIVPLRGKTVSGLHVPWNLQLLEAKVNIAKRNKLLD